MDTTNHNNRLFSFVQKTQHIYCLAPEARNRGVYFDVEFILQSIQTNILKGISYLRTKEKSPLSLRIREYFCKEKEKLFAKLRGSPPAASNTCHLEPNGYLKAKDLYNLIHKKLREAKLEFAGIAVYKECEVLDEN